jgi:hypothetical protein
MVSDLEILRALADLEPGHVASVQASWEVAGEDRDARRRVRMVITSLCRDGTIGRIFARYRDEPLEIIRLDRDALLAKLDEEQR